MQEKTEPLITQKIAPVLNSLIHIAIPALIVGGALLVAGENAPKIAQTLHMSAGPVGDYIHGLNIISGSVNQVIGFAMAIRPGINAINDYEEATPHGEDLSEETQNRIFGRFLKGVVFAAGEVAIGITQFKVG